MKAKRGLSLVLILGIVMLLVSGVAMAQDPTVAITNPTAGSVVDVFSGPLNVSGTSANLPADAQIQVRARDASGSALGEQIVGINADGTWSAAITFTVSVDPGDKGSLIAFVLNAGGGLLATAPVIGNIQYGTEVAVPSIQINTPSEGTSLDVDDPVSVQGTTTDRPASSSVVLRAYTDSGTLLGETTAAINADGTWATNLTLTNAGAVVTNTTGYIEASLVVGGVGNTFATDRQNVNWLQTNAPTISIAFPTSGAEIDAIGTPITITGNTTFAPSGARVLARARDASNNNIGEQIVNVNADGTWSATFNLTITPANGSSGSVIAFLQTQSGSLLATAPVVSVKYVDVPPSPQIGITFPTEFAQVNFTTPFNVSGFVNNLPANTKVQVQIGDAGGVVIGVGESLNPGSSWSATINWGRFPRAGERVSTTAYLIEKTSGAGLGRSQQVNFFFRTGNQPSVNITNPLPNAVVPNRFPITVQGTQVGAFEGNVVVRAVNAFGTVLAQQPTTSSGIGDWNTSLTVNVPDGTLGSIVAFITSPRDGSIVASDSVDVAFGAPCVPRTDLYVYRVQRGDTLLKLARATGSTVQELALYNCLRTPNVINVGQTLYLPAVPVFPTPQPQQPTINIETPLNNATLDATSAITVRGNGQNLSGMTIIIRALDANGNILVERSTSPQNNTFEQAIQLDLDRTTDGAITAIVRNSSGTALVDDIISVTFAVPDTDDGEAAHIEFTNVQPDSLINENSIVAVTGFGSNISGSPVFLRALDGEGNVISEVEAQVSPADDDGFDWEARLLVREVNTARGLFVAYALDPLTDQTIAIASAPVIYGEPTNEPFVTLENPLPYATLDLDRPVEISGRFGNVTGGEVIIRALDGDGDVLLEEPADMLGSSYELSIDINAAVGTRGKLVALLVDDSSQVVARQVMPVMFGDPMNNTLFVLITTPLDGATISDSLLIVKGVADARSVEHVTVDLLDTGGNVLAEVDATTTTGPDDNQLVWSAELTLPASVDGPAMIRAFSVSPVDDTPLAHDEINVTLDMSPAEVPSEPIPPDTSDGASG